MSVSLLADDSFVPEAVSRIASVNVCLEQDVLRLPSLAYHPFFFFNFWDLATLSKLNTEMRICRTKFGVVMHIIKNLTTFCCCS